MTKDSRVADEAESFGSSEVIFKYQNTMTYTLVGLMEAVSKPNSFGKAETCVSISGGGNRKAVGALYQAGN